MQTPDDMQEDPALAALIKSHATRYAAPPELADRIRQRVASPVANPRVAEAPHRTMPTFASSWRGWLQAVALFGAGAATTAVIAISLFSPPGQDALIDQLTASHVRSLMASHLDDVASSDQHTVRPWFAGKLDYSPPVVDLAAEGFPLTGGRLDYVAGRPVAALVYRSGVHVINLFVWPADEGNAVEPHLFERKGFSVVRWTQGGMQAWAVSDLNAAELKSFAKVVRERMVAPSSQGPA